MKQIAPSISSSARESSHFNLLTRQNRSGGFTIVELLIVIVVIAILATVAIVAYNGISQKAHVVTLQSDLSHAATALGMANAENSAYPSNANDCPSPIPGSGNICLKSSPGTSYQYTYTNTDNSYCLTATNSGVAYMISNVNSVSKAGACAGHTGYIAPPWTVTQLSTGGGQPLCALASGQAYCWGGNMYGQLGNGTTTDSLIPVPVSTAGVLAGKTVTAISIGSGHSCAIANGQAYCWGGNGRGELGNGTTANSNVPVATTTTGVLSGKTLTSIAAGNANTCVVANGQAYCWGWDGVDQLGDGTTTDSSVPVAVSTAGVLGGKTVTNIVIGTSNSCAIANGQAYCWGQNSRGALGNGSIYPSSVPVAVSTAGVLAGKTITAISSNVNGANVCVVASGQVYCWGDNAYGMLGDGTTTSSGVPVAVSTAGVLSGLTATTVATGTYSSCAIASGQAYCWGYNGNDQLGNGSTISSNVPVAVSTAGVLAGKTITSISAKSPCVVANDGQAYCWGWNLGNGTTNMSVVPVLVTHP